MTPEYKAEPPADELTIAKLPDGWRFRVVESVDGARLKAVWTRDDAQVVSQIRRQVQRGLTR